MEIVVKNGGPVYRFHGTNLVHFERGGGTFCTWACEGYAPPRFFSSRIGSRFVHFLDQSVLFCLVMSNYFVAPRIVAQTRFFPDSPLLIKVSLRFPPSAM